MVNNIGKHLFFVTKHIRGLTPPETLMTLFNLAVATSDVKGDIVEVGSWCGQSTVMLAEACRIGGYKDKVHAVDLFPHKDGWEFDREMNRIHYNYEGVSEYMEYDSHLNVDIYEKDIVKAYERYDDLHDEFMRSIALTDTQDIVKSFKGNSKDFVDRNQFMTCKLAFIDAEHSYKGCKNDIENIERILVSGGWIAIDDYGGRYEGVTKAVNEMITEKKYEMIHQPVHELVLARRL